MISTSSVTRLNKLAACKRFGVDDFAYDWEATMTRKPDVYKTASTTTLFGTSFETEKFTCPIVHWRVGDQWFSAAVPVVTKELRWKKLFSGGVNYVYDWDKMKKEVEALIFESKKLVPRFEMEKTNPCDRRVTEAETPKPSTP